jgi:uracil-DNA glycosylase family 4
MRPATVALRMSWRREQAPLLTKVHPAGVLSCRGFYQPLWARARSLSPLWYNAVVTSLQVLQSTVIRCRRCPRLVSYRENVAKTKVRRFLDWKYWARPLPGFGAPDARLLIVGLAPAAHGGNRTGRIFTGDRSGDWLYAALYRFGFANQPQSVSRDDGMRLIDCYITAAVKCAPPDNKPLPGEFQNCRPYLVQELQLLKHTKVVIALGKIAMDSYFTACRELGRQVPVPRPVFGHGRVYPLPWGETLITSYHPSQQNTFTGKLTVPMFDAIFATAKKLLDKARAPSTPVPTAL